MTEAMAYLYHRNVITQLMVFIEEAVELTEALNNLDSENLKKELVDTYVTIAYPKRYFNLYFIPGYKPKPEDWEEKLLKIIKSISKSVRDVPFDLTETQEYILDVEKSLDIIIKEHALEGLIEEVYANIQQVAINKGYEG